LQLSFLGQISLTGFPKLATQSKPPSHQAQFGSNTHFVLSRVSQETAI